jgi:hypothetical protein
MGWISDLGRAVLAYVWALMSCAAFTILGVIALIFKWDNAWLIRGSFILAGLSVIVAIALAYRDQYNKLQVELSKNSFPKFQLEISRVVRDATPHQGIPWRDCGNTYVACLSLVNVQSSPSSVRSVYVKVGDEDKEYLAMPFQVARLGWSSDGRTHTFNGESVTERKWHDDLIEDILPSLKNPAMRGVHKEGWIFLDDLPSIGDAKKLLFYVVDAFGNTHGPFESGAEMEWGNVRKS